MRRGALPARTGRECISCAPSAAIIFAWVPTIASASIVDGDFSEVGADVDAGDPLGWVDKKSYPAKLNGDREKSGLTEAVVCGFGQIGGFEVAFGGDGFPFSRGYDGDGRRRADRATVGRGASPQGAVHHLYRIGRRADGRRNARARPNGQDHRGRYPLYRRRELFAGSTYRSDDRWRRSLVCVSGRRNRRRAEGDDRISPAGGSSSRRSARSCPINSKRRSFCWKRARSTWSSSATPSKICWCDYSIIRRRRADE